MIRSNNSCAWESKFVVMGLLLASLMLNLGCFGNGSGRPTTYPVTGTVKLNGKPVDGATVTFQLIEGKGNSIGSTDKDGKFSLSMFRPNDGAIPGQYKVSISKFDVEPPKTSALVPGQINSGDLPAEYSPPAASGGTAGAGTTGPKNSLPAKFANADSSGLRAMVDAKGDNSFDFDLK